MPAELNAVSPGRHILATWVHSSSNAQSFCPVHASTNAPGRLASIVTARNGQRQKFRKRVESRDLRPRTPQNDPQIPLKSHFLTDGSPESTTRLFNFFRFVGGFGVRLCSIASSMYIAEMAPPAKRGGLGMMYQLAIVVGHAVAPLITFVVTKILKPSLWSYRRRHPRKPLAAGLAVDVFLSVISISYGNWLPASSAANQRSPDDRQKLHINRLDHLQSEAIHMLQECGECKQSVSTSAEVCPHCGYRLMGRENLVLCRTCNKRCPSSRPPTRYDQQILPVL